MDNKGILNYRTHGGRIKDVEIDLSVNTNPLGPPKRVYEILKENLELIKYYPEENSYSLKKLYAQKWGVEPQNIIFGNGASELIFLYMNSLSPKRVIIPIPSFSEYYIASVSKRCYIVLPLYKKDGYTFIPPYEEIIDAISPDSLVILGNPNNPTGTLYDRERLFDIVNKALKRNAYVFIDEAFIEFAKKGKSFVSFVNKFPNLFILRSFTKIFTISGIRLGAGVGSENVIAKMESLRDPWSVNVFSQILAKYLVGEDEFIEKSQNFIDEEKAYIFEHIKRFKDIKIYDTDTNFYLLQFFNLSSYKVVKELLNMGIYVRDASNFIGLSDGFIRVAIKKRKENTKFINSVKFLLK